MKKGIGIAVSAVVLSSCGLVPPTPDTLAQADDRRLCYLFGRWLRAGDIKAVSNIQGEMTGRRIERPTPQEMNAIVKEGYFIGMSECALVAALGDNAYHRNQTVTASGTRTQYVVTPAFGRAYVYTEDGRVVAIQR